MKSLILNADDYGMNEAVSRGILKAAAEGPVRAASAMANCPDFDRAMDDLAGSGASLDVGVHLTLTWGEPLSKPREIPTLVDDDGRFHERAVLLRRALLGSVSEAEAYREFRAQCARLSERLPRITHLDGHHHVHSYPTICRAAERVAREFEIPFVRAPREGLWSPWRWYAARRVGIAMLAASGRRYWRERGFKTADYFGGFALGGVGDFKRRWIESLDRIPEGVGEVMVHPGLASVENDSYDVGRRAELDWLSGSDLSESAEERGVGFTSFSELFPS